MKVIATAATLALLSPLGAAHAEEATVPAEGRSVVLSEADLDTVTAGQSLLGFIEGRLYGGALAKFREFVSEDVQAVLDGIELPEGFPD